MYTHTYTYTRLLLEGVCCLSDGRRAIMVQKGTSGRFDEWRGRVGLSHDAAIKHLLDHQDETGIFREIDAAARDLERAVRDHFCAELGDAPAMLRTIAVNLRLADSEERVEIAEKICQQLVEYLTSATAAKTAAEERQAAARLDAWQGAKV